jgi:hypothetical protein
MTELSPVPMIPAAICSHMQRIGCMNTSLGHDGSKMNGPQHGKRSRKNHEPQQVGPRIIDRNNTIRRISSNSGPGAT